jgi:hypothetical protein
MTVIKLKKIIISTTYPPNLTTNLTVFYIFIRYN